MATIPAVTKLSSRVIRILGCNPYRLTQQGTNTYLIGSGYNRILIDAGDKDVSEYQRNLDLVLQTMKANILHIVVTHWHPDHIGGVENLFGNIARQPTIWKHNKSTSDGPEKELPETIPNKWLFDGQQICVEDATIKVYHTPGHTTDHVVVMLAEENAIFSGDCVISDGHPAFEDLYSYMQSLQRILDLKPCVIYPGHGNIIEDPEENIKQYIAFRNKRDDEILEIFKSDKEQQLNAMDLVKIIFKDTPEHLYLTVAYDIGHHLNKLTKENKIKRVNVNGCDKWQINDEDTENH